MKTRLTLALAVASATVTPCAHAALDTATAQALARQFYGALTATDRTTLQTRLTQATATDWRNCSAADACQDRTATLARWTGRMAAVPDLRWTQHALLLAGDDSFVVRGEATGTPRAPFLGVVPTGASFRVMTLDLHRVQGGRIVETHHVEDWGTALRQLTAPATP